MTRILHWNIHMWTDADGVDNVDRVTDVIGHADPDVVSLVEVDEPWGRPSKLAQMADTLGYHWAFIPAFEYREAGGFGNAILAKQPLDNVQQWQLLPPMLYDGTEPTEPRAVVLAQITTTAGPLIVGSTHLPRSDDQHRKHASNRLLDLLRAVAEPFIVCGDFNQPPSTWVPTDVTTAPDPPMPTYPAAAPRESIDYCLASGLTIQSAATIDNAASDHLPIVITTAPD